MNPRVKTDFLNRLKKFWKYSEEHPELVLGIATLLSGLLAFLWSNGRFLFWVLLASTFGLVLISLSVLAFTALLQTDPPLKEWAWFFNVGENNQHGGSWQACREYGFLSAGGGPSWRDAAQRLSVGDPVYAYVNGAGYVGFGEVLEEAIGIKDFTVGIEKRPLLSEGILPDNLRKNLEAASDNPEYSDWVVRIKWHKTYSIEEAFSDAYVSPQTVCRFKNKNVLKSLRQGFSS